LLLVVALVEEHQQVDIVGDAEEQVEQLKMNLSLLQEVHPFL
jgi:hypothetical protein